MEIQKILVRNIKQLQTVHGLDSAAKVARFINKHYGEEVIDRSYVARVLKNSEKDPANFTLNKLALVAEGFKVELWQLLNPMGFSASGVSLAASGSVDKRTLKDAVRYSVDAAREVGIDNPDFISEVATEAYEGIATDNKEKLGFTLAKLSQAFS